VDKQEKALSEIGYTACYRVVGIMLTMLGYGLQASKKTLAVSPSHEDRNGGTPRVNTTIQTLQQSSLPPTVAAVTGTETACGSLRCRNWQTKLARVFQFCTTHLGQANGTKLNIACFHSSAKWAGHSPKK
jgi:hypothetical protein